MRNLWYFGLEPLKERYTYQLSEQWIPETFKGKDVLFRPVYGKRILDEIKVGSVLDAYGRGAYSMSQCDVFMNAILSERVKDGDIIYLQDFWTPGIEAVFYMLDLYNIKVDVYSMLHAQSVDEYDFTHPMRKWMRHFELGIDAYHKGIFVGSGIHKQQLRDAGFKAPIHVVGLPIHAQMTVETCERIYKKQDQIIYTSRLDKEKNPYFMIEVALSFLRQHQGYKWVVTTSGNDFKSSIPGFVEYMKQIASENDRFVLKAGLSKEEYYAELQKSKVQFNSSLQDYVSWTLIESALFDCDVCYPNFRSFPEILNNDRLYQPFKVDSAINVLNDCIIDSQTHFSVPHICDLGRRLEAYIMLNDIGTQEFNVWHEHYYISKLIEKC